MREQHARPEHTYRTKHCGHADGGQVLDLADAAQEPAKVRRVGLKDERLFKHLELAVLEKLGEAQRRRRCWGRRRR